MLPFDWKIIINSNFSGLIEYDGGQHFAPNGKHGMKSFVSTQSHDKIKNNFCEQEKIYLLRVDYTQCSKNLLLKHIVEFIKAIRNKQKKYVTYCGTKYIAN